MSPSKKPKFTLADLMTLVARTCLAMFWFFAGQFAGNLQSSPASIRMAIIGMIACLIVGFPATIRLRNIERSVSE